MNNRPSDAAGITGISESLRTRFQPEPSERIDFNAEVKNWREWAHSGTAIPQPRFIVRESYGYGHGRGIRINETSAPRELARSTVNEYIRDLKKWAGGYADHVTDVNSAGWRLVTAHHWINGFENIHVLHIQKSTVYNRMQAGME